MITRLTGILNLVLPDRIRLQVGPVEYELLVAETLRSRLEGQVGREISLHTRHYLEGGAMQNQMFPRLIGFTSEAEIEFFDLFCTVDKIGTRKALKALCRPIREIATAILEDDQKYLSKLPGIGAATAEKIVATLRRKVAKFALMRCADEPQPSPAEPAVEVHRKEATKALVDVGYSLSEARDLVERALRSGHSFSSTEELLQTVFRLQHGS